MLSARSYYYTFQRYGCEARDTFHMLPCDPATSSCNSVEPCESETASCCQLVPGTYDDSEGSSTEAPSSEFGSKESLLLNTPWLTHHFPSLPPLHIALLQPPNPPQPCPWRIKRHRRATKIRLCLYNEKKKGPLLEAQVFACLMPVDEPCAPPMDVHRSPL